MRVRGLTWLGLGDDDVRLDPALGTEAARADQLVAAARAALDALVERSALFVQLETAAADLDAREQAVALRELAVAGNEQRAEALTRWEAALDEVAATQAAMTSELDDREARLTALAEALALREERFSSRWRWLIRTWRHRPRLSRERLRVCDLLFVPSAAGYTLLDQRGLALEVGARVTGVLGADHAYVVTKIAPWAFDGRWCAYLQAE